MNGSSEDALKVIYEDRIPTLAMFNRNITYINNNGVSSKNTSIISRGDGGLIATSTPLVESQVGTIGWKEYDGAVISGNYIAGELVNAGWIGLYKTANNLTNFSLPTGRENHKYLYYAGTAPAYPILTFNMAINSSCFENDYVKCPLNEYVSGNGYNTISIEGNKIN